MMVDKSQRECVRDILKNTTKEHKTFIISFTMFMFIVLVSVTFYAVSSFSPKENFLTLINNIILFCTMVVLIWYTCETSGLRKEAQKQVTEIQRQTEIQQRPFVIFVSFREDNKITVENIGNGSALSVKVFCIKINISELLCNRARRENINVLPSHKIITYRPVSHMKYNDITSSTIFLFDNHIQSQTSLHEMRDLIIILRIEFFNVNNILYSVEEFIKEGYILNISSDVVNTSSKGNYITTIYKNGKVADLHLSETGEKYLESMYGTSTSDI